MTTRRRFTAEFKARVALGLLLALFASSAEAQRPTRPKAPPPTVPERRAPLLPKTEAAAGEDCTRICEADLEAACKGQKAPLLRLCKRVAGNRHKACLAACRMRSLGKGAGPDSGLDKVDGSASRPPKAGETAAEE